MNRILFIVSVVCLFSCKGKPELNEDVNTKIFCAYLDGETASPVKLSDFIDSVSFLPIVSDRDILIADIADVRCFKGHFYIWDSKSESIVEVDGLGNIVQVLSKQGRAPGEYLNITAFDVNPSNGDIHIYDGGSRQILIYDCSGNFLRKVAVSDVIRDFSVFSNEEYVFYTPDYMKGNRRGLWRVDRQGNFKEQLVSIDENFRYGGIYPKYLRRIDDETVCLMGGEDYDRIYHLTKDAVTVPYKLDIDRKISEELKRRNESERSEKYAGVCYTKNDYMETDNLMMLAVTDMRKRLLLLYNKRNGKIGYVRKQEDLIEDINAYTLPRYGNNGVMVGVLEVGFILSFKALQEEFPFITTDSNPVLVVYH